MTSLKAAVLAAMIPLAPQTHPTRTLDMFFIWGKSTDTVSVGSGNFYCPHCCAFTKYSVQEVRQTSHVYFIKLGGGTAVGEHVECERCRKQFTQEVLKYVPPDPQAALRVLTRRNLIEGVSVAVVEDRLKEGGFEPGQAAALVNETCGGKFRKCECGRRYHPAVMTCKECDLTLPWV
jgi:hypothetical protein